MTRGDRVKLTRKVAKPMMTRRKSYKTDWYARCGTVVCVSPVADSITVVWDDRASTDVWPTRALQRIE
jgi:hypothetical protein